MPTHQEIMVALDRVGGVAECPSCGANEWMGMGLGGQSDRLYLLTEATGAEEPGEASGYGMHGVYCARCGFVRLHRLDSLGLE